MRRALITLVAGSMLAAITATPSSADHSWGGYHWSRSSNPAVLTLVNSLTSEWDSYLATSKSDWDASSVIAFNADVQGSEVSKDRKRCTAQLGTIRVCNALYGYNGWLGVANVWLYSGTTHIAQSTVKLNDSYFQSSTYNKPSWRNFVMCQEVGHGFGLDHQDENFDNANLGSCMDYTNTPLGPPNNEHPNQHDFDQLASDYGHLDSSASAPTGSGRGNRASYETDSHGYRVLTYVLFAR